MHTILDSSCKRFEEIRTSDAEVASSEVNQTILKEAHESISLETMTSSRQLLGLPPNLEWHRTLGLLVRCPVPLLHIAYALLVPLYDTRLLVNDHT